MIELSKRLGAVAEQVLPGGTLADIGTDHALLPVALVQRGHIPRAVAGDIHEGPAAAAERQVRAAGLEDRVDVRIGNGLAVLRPGEAATIAIAGMGGGTIVDILSSGGEALAGVRRLVLQPNIGERLVREWLLRQDWKLTAETLLEEEGLMYEVLTADRATDPAEAREWNEALYEGPVDGAGAPVPRAVRLLMGPHLLRRPTELFVRKWTAYSAKLDALIEQIGRSDSLEAKKKREELSQERNEVNEVLSWLSK
ncbi:class I SAM-dependent methyltransferase [Paenibacillus sp.]|uniref:tRNA (adenine(22)-N(1))-methyltransferase n=1 Tax=Paenibacillus sp. TaxID=58172 RepID=UPI002D271C42|nr:class I SAM-dependent methyltransferase [Paenibacillus sp.]HZG84674.1 class I SAM-dependent methyltransferase [Paenibacillus sp.]